MKILQILFVYSIILLVSCSNESGPDTTILYGVVLDYETNEPVEKVQVSTIPASEVVLTDNAGRFEIRTPEAGEFTVIARHKDYITSNEQIATSHNYNTTVTILMRKGNDNPDGDYALISGTITSLENNEPLENVRIATTPDTDVYFSDNNGEFSIEISDLGIYEIEFQKSGYKSVTKELEVTDYINYNLNIEMEKELAGKDEPLYYDDVFRYWNFNNNTQEIIKNTESMVHNEVSFEDTPNGGAVVLQNNSYIELMPVDFKSMSEFSISIWIKHMSFAHYNGGGYLVCGSIEDGYLGILNAIKPLNIKTDDERYLYFASGAQRDADKEYEDIQPIYLDFDYNNEWTHYIITYYNSSLIVYINGEFQAQAVQPVKYNPETFLLGAHITDKVYQNVITRVNAAYDELIIYNREMTASEVKQIYEHY